LAIGNSPAVRTRSLGSADQRDFNSKLDDTGLTAEDLPPSGEQLPLEDGLLESARSVEGRVDNIFARGGAGENTQSSAQGRVDNITCERAAESTQSSAQRRHQMLNGQHISLEPQLESDASNRGDIVMEDAGNSNNSNPDGGSSAAEGVRGKSNVLHEQSQAPESGMNTTVVIENTTVRGGFARGEQSPFPGRYVGAAPQPQSPEHHHQHSSNVLRSRASPPGCETTLGSRINTVASGAPTRVENSTILTNLQSPIGTTTSEGRREMVSSNDVVNANGGPSLIITPRNASELYLDREKSNLNRLRLELARDSSSSERRMAEHKRLATAYEENRRLNTSLTRTKGNMSRMTTTGLGVATSKNLPLSGSRLNPRGPNPDDLRLDDLSPRGRQRRINEIAAVQREHAERKRREKGLSRSREREKQRRGQMMGKSTGPGSSCAGDQTGAQNRSDALEYLRSQRTSLDADEKHAFYSPRLASGAQGPHMSTHSLQEPNTPLGRRRANASSPRSAYSPKRVNRNFSFSPRRGARSVTFSLSPDVSLSPAVADKTSVMNDNHPHQHSSRQDDLRSIAHVYGSSITDQLGGGANSKSKHWNPSTERALATQDLDMFGDHSHHHRSNSSSPEPNRDTNLDIDVFLDRHRHWQDTREHYSRYGSPRDIRRPLSHHGSPDYLDGFHRKVHRLDRLSNKVRSKSPRNVAYNQLQWFNSRLRGDGPLGESFQTLRKRKERDTNTTDVVKMYQKTKKAREKFPSLAHANNPGKIKRERDVQKLFGKSEGYTPFSLLRQRARMSTSKKLFPETFYLCRDTYTTASRRKQRETEQAEKERDLLKKQKIGFTRFD